MPLSKSSISNLKSWIRILNNHEGESVTKTFFLCALLIGAAAARENPFFAADESLRMPVTSNIPDTLPKLTSLPYNLPNEARVLKEVSFTIQNVDGSIETRTVNVDQSIDWHRPLVIAQASRAKGGEASDKTALNNAKSSSADFGFVRFDANGKHLTIHSNYAVIRHFMLTEPNRIIIDFKRKEIFTPKEKVLNSPPYTSVGVANHGQFIRTTVILDGRYDYTLNKGEGVVSVDCR